MLFCWLQEPVRSHVVNEKTNGVLKPHRLLTKCSSLWEFRISMVLMESVPGNRMSRAHLHDVCDLCTSSAWCVFPSAWRQSSSFPGKHDTACVPASPGLSPSLHGGRHPWQGRGLWGSYSGFEGVLQCFTAALTGPASWVNDGALPMVAAGSDGAATAEGSFGILRQFFPQTASPRVECFFVDVAKVVAAWPADLEIASQCTFAEWPLWALQGSLLLALLLLPGVNGSISHPGVVLVNPLIQYSGLSCLRGRTIPPCKLFSPCAVMSPGHLLPPLTPPHRRKVMVQCSVGPHVESSAGFWESTTGTQCISVTADWYRLLAHASCYIR